MPRPGFITTIDRSSPPIPIWRGDKITRTSFPIGTQLVYPPEPRHGKEHVRTLVRDAIAQPLAGQGLQERLNANTRLAIVVRDTNEFGYPLRNDVRKIIAEEVLELAAQQHVDDARLIVARGTRGRLNDQQLRNMLGDRIVDSFLPHDLLTQHNIDDRENLSTIWLASYGEVTVSKALLDANCVVVIDIASSSSHRHNDDALSDLLGTDIYRQALSASHNEFFPSLLKELAEKIDAFYLVATHNGDVLPKPLSFSTKRNQTRLDSAIMQGGIAFARALPAQILREAHRHLSVEPEICTIVSGTQASVIDRIVEDRDDHTAVMLDERSDIVSIGVSPSVATVPGSPIDPFLAASSALSTAAPFVHNNGVVIIHHDFEAEFDPKLHAASADYYAEVIRKEGVEQCLEDANIARYADEKWYRNLYTTAYAFHGLHPLQLMAKIVAIRERLRNVIVIGGNPEVTRNFGFRPATTLSDALELSRDALSTSQPSLLHLHVPPSVTVKP